VTINAKRSLSSDEELEEDGEDAVEESDPVTIVILLTDTDLELPSEIEEGEQDIEDELERDDGSAEVPSADQ
jgi:hypothetical protein